MCSVTGIICPKFPGTILSLLPLLRLFELILGFSGLDMCMVNVYKRHQDLFGSGYK